MTTDEYPPMTAEDLATENKMASLHGPYMDKHGPFYVVAFPGRDDRRFRKYDAATNAALRHNDKVQMAAAKRASR